jgi:hypothetical protein
MVLIDNLTHFWFISIDGDQNIRQIRIPLKTKSFLPLVVHFSEFGPN